MCVCLELRYLYELSICIFGGRESEGPYLGFSGAVNPGCASDGHCVARGSMHDTGMAKNNTDISSRVVAFGISSIDSCIGAIRCGQYICSTTCSLAASGGVFVCVMGVLWDVECYLAQGESVCIGDAIRTPLVLASPRVMVPPLVNYTPRHTMPRLNSGRRAVSSWWPIRFHAACCLVPVL